MGSSGVGTSRWSCMRSSVTVYICTCFFFKATPIWNKWLSNWENYSFQISIVSELLFDKQKNILSRGLTKFVNQGSGHIRLSVSTVNHTNELSGITHVTPFCSYGKHSTGPSTYGLWVHTYSKLFSCKSVLMVCGYRSQSNEICTYRKASCGSLLRVRKCGLLYLQTVEYDHCMLELSLLTQQGLIELPQNAT